ncbi:hypothetical protein KBD34_04785 [Patescibacteria group bacterium]|nr:hypothetical protein [Patescibacteria group bacterium]
MEKAPKNSAPSKEPPSKEHPRRQNGGPVSSFIMATVLEAAALFGAQAAGSYGAEQRDRQAAEQRIRDEEAEKSRARGTGAEARSETLSRIFERAVRIERIKRERLALVERVRRELREGTFDLGEFILTTNRLDASEDENRDVDIESARRELTRLQEHFVQVWQELGRENDAETISQALEITVRGYRYYRLNDLLLTDTLNEHVAACRKVSHLLTAILWKAGIQSVAIRVYSPPEGQRFSHEAPILLTQDGHRMGEVDLLSGGDPMRDEQGRLQGTLVSIPEFVEAYARHHGMVIEGASRLAASSDPLDDADDTEPVGVRPSVGSGLASEHFLFPVPPPTQSAAFPEIMPIVGQGIMRPYESDHGRIIPPHSRERRQEDQERPTDCLTSAISPIQILLARRDENIPTSNVLWMDRIEAVPGLIDSISGKLDAVDALLDRETVPAKTAVLTAASLAMWQVMHTEWVQQQKPRSAESAASMVRTRSRELHELLAHLSVDEILTDLHVQLSGTGDPEEVENYLVILPGILLDHEYGWSLLYGVMERFLQVERSQQLSYFGNAATASLFQSAHTTSEMARVAQLIQPLSVAKRGNIYYSASRIGELPTGNTLEMREARLVNYFSSYHVDENLTGIVRTTNSASQAPRIISRHPPVWESFEQLQHFVDRKVQENNLDPAWSRVHLFTVINGLRMARNSATDLTELSRIQHMMRQSLPWLRQVRNELVRTSEFPREVDNLIQEIAELPSTEPTVLLNQDVGEE